MADNLVNNPDGSDNPYLEAYKFKRKLGPNYFRLIDQKFPQKNVCLFCLTPKHKNANIACSEQCKKQLEFRSGHKLMRDTVLARDKFCCQLCGVSEASLAKALNILKKSNRKLWALKREELRIPKKRIGILLDADHILPISKGGGSGMIGDILTNIWSLCLSCHYFKDFNINGATTKSPIPKAKNRKVLR